MLFLSSLLQHGDTPAHFAVDGGRADCLELLLKAGANTEAKNNVRLLSQLLQPLAQY